MRHFAPALLGLGLLAAALAGCSRESRQHAADERLRAIYTSEWRWRSEQQPEDENGTRPVAGHLPKVDPATQQMRLRYWEDVQRRLAGIARASLSPKEQLNYDIYRQQIAVLIANQRFRDFEMPANSDTTFWTDVGYTARRPFLPPRAILNAGLPQMRDIPLLPRGDGRECAQQHEARFHAAAGDDGGRDALDRRRRGGFAGRPLLYALPRRDM